MLFRSERGPFMGFEINPGTDRKYGAVNPGVGIGAVKGLDLYKSILDYYAQLSFLRPDGSYNTTDAVVNITTRELVKSQLKNISGIQEVSGITIYPADYFNPFNDVTGRLNKTPNTRTIHWFTKTWMNVSPWRQWLSRFVHRVFGVDVFSKCHSIIKK